MVLSERSNDPIHDVEGRGSRLVRQEDTETIVLDLSGLREVGWTDCGVHACRLLFSRAHGVRRNRPITLPVTPSTYPLDDPVDAYKELGLRYLTSIFRPLSDIFFAVWNGSTEDCSKEWLLKLERDVRTALPVVLEISNEETANIRISQFWLQIKLWELFPRFGYLSTDSVHDCLTFRYPILVARDLTILSMKLPIQSLQIHGVGMVRCYHPSSRCC